MADLAGLRDWKQIAATTRQLGRYDARSRVICYTAADAIEEMVAELKQLQDDNATLRAAQKACEHCDSGIAAVVEERDRCMAELAECRRDAERLNNGVVIGTYTGKDGHRDWWSGGTWLHKGEQVVVIDAASAEGER